jgi:hypothetical protein
MGQSGFLGMLGEENLAADIFAAPGLVLCITPFTGGRETSVRGDSSQLTALLKSSAVDAKSAVHPKLP